MKTRALPTMFPGALGDAQQSIVVSALRPRVLWPLRLRYLAACMLVHCSPTLSAIGTTGAAFRWPDGGSRSSEAVSLQTPGLRRWARPNRSLERTRNGKALCPRSARCYPAPRGHSAMPLRAAQLQRYVLWEVLWVT